MSNKKERLDKLFKQVKQNELTLKKIKSIPKPVHRDHKLLDLKYKIREQINENKKRKDCEGKVTRYNSSKNMLNNSMMYIPLEKYMKNLKNLNILKEHYKNECPGYKFNFKKSLKERSKRKISKRKISERRNSERERSKRKISKRKSSERERSPRGKVLKRKNSEKKKF